MFILFLFYSMFKCVFYFIVFMQILLRTRSALQSSHPLVLTLLYFAIFQIFSLLPKIVSIPLLDSSLNFSIVIYLPNSALIASHVFFASPNNISVLLLKNTGLSTPAYPEAMDLFMNIVCLARHT